MNRQLIFLTLVSLFAGCKASVNNSAPPPAQVSQAPTTQISSAMIGKSCRVSIRRDALGMSAPGFAEPMAPMIGGKPALLTGTVEQLSESWLVLHGESKTYWIPTSSILMIETTR